MIYVYHSYRDRGVNLFVQDTPFDNIVNLSLNLRNTSDIAGILIKLREQLIQDNTAEETAIIDVIVPKLRPGHWIHGPRTVVHVMNEKVDWNDFSLIGSIFTSELNKLCINTVTGGLTVGIVTYDFDNRHLVDKIIKERSSVSDCKIEGCDIDGSYSVEYPVVIVVHGVSFDDDIPALYLEISRARVYCVIILYTFHLDSISENQYVASLLDKLEDTVKIVRH